MPSRRKQTVGSCQFAQGHRRSTPCGGAGNLTEGSSSLRRVQPSLCLRADCPRPARRCRPTIKPPSCCFSLGSASATRTLVSVECRPFNAVTGLLEQNGSTERSQRPSASCMQLMCIFDGFVGILHVVVRHEWREDGLSCASSFLRPCLA